MPETFDPYLQWLGIDPEDRRRLTAYRLLGLPQSIVQSAGRPLTDSEKSIVENLAEQKLSHVRQFQRKHPKQVERIASELVKSRRALLDDEAKLRYDAKQLESRRVEEFPVAVPAAPLPKAKTLDEAVAPPPVAAETSAVPLGLSSSAAATHGYARPIAVRPTPRVEAGSPQSESKSPAPSGWESLTRPFPLAIAVGSVLTLLVVAIVLSSLLRSTGPEVASRDNPSATPATPSERTTKKSTSKPRPEPTPESVDTIADSDNGSPAADPAASGPAVVPTVSPTVSESTDGERDSPRPPLPWQSSADSSPDSVASPPAVGEDPFNRPAGPADRIRFQSEPRRDPQLKYAWMTPEQLQGLLDNSAAPPAELETTLREKQAAQRKRESYRQEVARLYEKLLPEYGALPVGQVLQAARGEGGAMRLAMCAVAATISARDGKLAEMKTALYGDDEHYQQAEKNLLIVNILHSLSREELAAVDSMARLETAAGLAESEFLEPLLTADEFGGAVRAVAVAETWIKNLGYTDFPSYQRRRASVGLRDVREILAARATEVETAQGRHERYLAGLTAAMKAVDAAAAHQAALYWADKEGASATWHAVRHFLADCDVVELRQAASSEEAALAAMPTDADDCYTAAQAWFDAAAADAEHAETWQKRSAWWAAQAKRRPSSGKLNLDIAVLDRKLKEELGADYAPEPARPSSRSGSPLPHINAPTVSLLDLEYRSYNAGDTPVGTTLPAGVLGSPPAIEGYKIANYFMIRPNDATDPADFVTLVVDVPYNAVGFHAAYGLNHTRSDGVDIYVHAEDSRGRELRINPLSRLHFGEGGGGLYVQSPLPSGTRRLVIRVGKGRMPRQTEDYDHFYLCEPVFSLR